MEMVELDLHLISYHLFLLLLFLIYEYVTIIIFIYTLPTDPSGTSCNLFLSFSIII